MIEYFGYFLKKVSWQNGHVEFTQMYCITFFFATVKWKNNEGNIHPKLRVEEGNKDIYLQSNYVYRLTRQKVNTQLKLLLS